MAISRLQIIFLTFSLIFNIILIFLFFAFFLIKNSLNVTRSLFCFYIYSKQHMFRPMSILKLQNIFLFFLIQKQISLMVIISLCFIFFIYACVFKKFNILLHFFNCVFVNIFLIHSE